MALYRNIAGFGSNEPSYSSLTLTGMPRGLGQCNALEMETGLQDSEVGSFFGDVFKGAQHFAAGLGMQVPRAAFLSLVRLNAFHYADKLYRAEQYKDTREKLEDLWWRVGGDEKALRAAVEHGRNTKPVISGFGIGCAGCTGCNNNGVGCVEAASGTACLIASAAVIVAAIIPIITSMLKLHKDPVATVAPVAEQPITSNLTLFLKNPVVIAAMVAIGLYYLTD